MKQFSASLKTLFLVAILLLTGLTSRAQVIVVATAGNTGPTAYIDLNSAFAAINAGTHQGAIGVAIMSNTVETGPCVLNSSGAGAALYTSVVIGPGNDGITVSGATTTGRGLIELNGADNVTIDGDNPNTPGINRNLTLTNTAANTVTFTSVVRIALSTMITSGDNDLVRNCIINGSAAGRNTAAATSTVGTENTTYGILVGGGASTVSVTTAPSAIASTATAIGAGITAASFTADNNTVTACARGIAVQGSVNTVVNLMSITNNIIGSPTAGNATTVYSRGMTLQGFNNATISGNTIQNMDWFVGTAQIGISLGDVSAAGTNAILERNIVNHVYNRATGTFGAYGINIAAGNSITVRNNFVTDINHDMSGGGAFSTTFGVLGIRIAAGTNHIVDYNSVNLFGTMPGTATMQILSASLAITNLGSTGIECRNNILANTLSGGPTANAHVSLFLPSGATSALNLTLNNNIYYSGTTAATQGIAQAGTTAGTGFYVASNFNSATIAPATNLRSYSSTLSAAGTNDNASYASTVAAPFVSTTDLHINNLAINAADADGKAVVVASITTDFDAATRDAVTPDIGADEFVLPNCAGASGGTISPATQSFCAGLSTTMTSTGATTGTGISYQWKISAASGGPYVNVSGGSGATSTSYTTAALPAGTYYYVLQTTCSFGPVTGLSNELTVTVNPTPTVSVTPTSASICQPGGSPVSLSASGATTYSWLPTTGLSSSTVANPTANPAATTTYTVTGTSAGCTGTATTTITIAEMPSISAPTASPSSICAGGSSQLNVSAGTTTSYVESATTFAPISSGAGTVTLCNATVQTTPLTAGSLDDGYWNNIAMPFSFNFFGGTFNTINVQTNGAVSFSPFTTTTGYNVTLPAAGAPNNTIAACFGDMDWRFGTSGTISCYTSGSAPNRIFVINYEGATGGGFYNSGLAPTVFVSTQVQLFETSNIIQIHSANIGSGTTVNHAQGIENGTGTVAVVVPGRNNTTWTATNDAVQFVPSGGPLAYSWSPATFLSSTTISNPMANGVTASTTYTVSATAGGCSATGTVTVTVGSALTSSANITPSPTVCVGANVTLNAVPAGGGAPYTYSWAGPNSFTSTLANPTLSGVTAANAGTYTVTVTDACTSTSVSQVTLTVNPLPVVTVTPTSATYCVPGPAIPLTASGALAYFWGPSAGLSGTTTANVTASPAATTTYTVTGTNATGCTATATTTITVGATPTVTVTATPSTICNGDNSQLLATGSIPVTGYTVTSIPYAPTVGSGPQAVTGDDNVSGAITLPFTFNFYGTAYTQAFVYSNGFIQLGTSSGSTTTYAKDLTTNGTPNNVIGGAWSDLNATANQITTYTTGVTPNRIFTVYFNGVGFYDFNQASLISGDMHLQIQLFETSNIVEIHVGDVTGVSTTTANNTMGIENAAGTASAFPAGRNFAAWNVSTPEAWRFTPNTGSYTYAWSPATFLNSTTISNPLASAVTGTTTYTATVTESSGCSASGNTTVTVNPTPTVTATASADPICAGSSTTLTASGAATYTWMPGSLTGTSVTVSPTATTTYTITGVSAAGCTGTGTITITVNPLPVVTLSGTNNFCTGGSTVLTGTNGGTSQWYMNGSAIIGANSNTYTVTAPGEYNMTKTNLNGCYDSAAVGITVIENPLPTVVANASAAAICSGSPETLTGSGASTYTWTGGVTDGVAFNPTSTNTYTVTGTDGNGCQNTDMTTVTVNPLPTVVANASATTICSGSPETLTGSGATTYTWTGGVSDGVAFNPTVTDTYTVTGTDGNGCQNTDMVTVTVNPLPTVTINFPNDTVCLNGGNFALTGESPAGGVWSGNGVTGSTFDPTVPGLGYTLITYTFSDVNGCSAMDTSSLWVDVCNGIVEHTNFANLGVFPNPNSGHFTVVINHAGGNGLLVITDALGQIISSENIVMVKDAATKEIDLGAYANGIYFVRFTTDTNSIVQKVTIQK